MSQLVNIDQIRARNALDHHEVKADKDGTNGKKEGDNLSGYPSLIINNGLIATLAFSVDKGGQHERIASAIASHLNDRGVIKADNARSLRDALCRGESATLRQSTHEALAFLSYLKRFHR
ncbi:MAG: type III-B CRISPR module-associated protein Cmr5 [Verrucomicrobiota bacterium JB025]|nr:type III-B CRISPR module-associated protein Cmr5 [Verrucomicrobiota bacterium JB025]